MLEPMNNISFRVSSISSKVEPVPDLLSGSATLAAAVLFFGPRALIQCCGVGAVLFSAGATLSGIRSNV